MRDEHDLAFAPRFMAGAVQASLASLANLANLTCLVAADTIMQVTHTADTANG